MAVGALFALLLGLVALRITGLYLALITLVFGLTLEESLFEVAEFTNGGAGQPADPAGLPDPDHSATTTSASRCSPVVVYVDWRLTRTKTGRALFALRENERVAAAFGINVTAFKLLAFVLSGAIAGLAGALFAYRYEYVTGADFDFFLALTFVLMVVVGGLNSRVGVILGAVLFFAARPRDPARDRQRARLHRGCIPGIGDGRAQFMPRMIGALLLLPDRWCSTRAGSRSSCARSPDGSAASRSPCTATRTPARQWWRAPVSVLEVRDLSIRFGGLQALEGRQHRRQRVGDRRPDRPQRRRQDDRLQLHHRLLQARHRHACATAARTSPGCRRTRRRRWASAGRSRTSAW